MKKKVLVSVQTTIDDNGQKEQHTTTQTGDLIRKDQMDVLIFDEKIDDDLPSVRNMVTIQRERVNMKRTGPVNMNQLFLLGKSTENMYSHPHGNLHMETSVKRIVYNVHPSGEGELRMTYTVKLNGQKARDHQLRLHFKEENE